MNATVTGAAQDIAPESKVPHTGVCLHALPGGDKLLVDTNVVEDPAYLQLPFETAIHYKFERDTSKWDPTPCDARF